MLFGFLELLIWVFAAFTIYRFWPRKDGSP